MDVADVVLYGLSIVQPMVTPASLEIPTLATEFFGLLGWLVESYPNKVCQTLTSARALSAWHTQIVQLSLDSLSQNESEISKRCLFPIERLIYSSKTNLRSVTWAVVIA